MLDQTLGGKQFERLAHGHPARFKAGGKLVLAKTHTGCIDTRCNQTAQFNGYLRRHDFAFVVLVLTEGWGCAHIIITLYS